jgi:hypothetical protein
MNSDNAGQPVVVADIANFDRRSGSVVERILFNHRLIVLLLCVLVTGFFAFQATRVQLNADFNDTIPTHQPYIVNYMKHYADLRSQGNAIRVVVFKGFGADQQPDLFAAECGSRLYDFAVDILHTLDRGDEQRDCQWPGDWPEL